MDQGHAGVVLAAEGVTSGLEVIHPIGRVFLSMGNLISFWRKGALTGLS